MTRKEELKKKIIKDIIPFAIATVATIVLMIVMAIVDPEGFRAIYAEATVFEGIIATILVPIILGFEVAGFIVGWKWLSKFVKAYNLLGVLIKVTISVFAGYIIYPVILIKDIIAYCKA